MPYVITTTNPTRLAELEAAFEHAGGRGVDLADEIDALREPPRRAVATLEEARTAIFTRMADLPRYMLSDAARLANSVNALTESGGTVGPLPDGTVIEVEPVSWADLRERAGLDRDGFTFDQVTLDAFNARESQ